MALSIKSLIESWEGIGVVLQFDAPTGTWIFVAIHSNALGQPTGGTRMKVYHSAAAGLQDAMRLARGMTSKWAALDMPFGGGKAVLAIPRRLKPKERHGLLTRYGQLVHSLSGSFATGVDLGTTAGDMSIVRKETPFVHGVDLEANKTIDPGPFTARGVYAGIKAAVKHVFGSGVLRGKVVHIQGVGHVGEPLARMLKSDGAQLVLSDLDSRRAERLAEEIGGAETFEPHMAYEARCDVYAPCATGGTLNAEIIPELRCRIVAGGANNQLDEDADAALLHERGILYAPDFVINGGGAIALGTMQRGERDLTAIEQRIKAIGQTLTTLFTDSQQRDESPLAAANRLVAKRLARSSQPET